MLNRIQHQDIKYTHWDRMQQPVHGGNQQADLLRLLAALDEGWQILEVANYLARGLNSEGKGYLLTLYHPARRLTREWNMAAASGIENILKFEGIQLLSD